MNSSKKWTKQERVKNQEWAFWGTPYERRLFCRGLGRNLKFSQYRIIIIFLYHHIDVRTPTPIYHSQMHFMGAILKQHKEP